MTDTNAAPFTLRFMEWRCGHHGTRPNDIPVHTIAQAQAIVDALGYAISQPGNARAALFDEWSGTSIYLADDHAGRINRDTGSWAWRTRIYYASAQELTELQGLAAAFYDCYGREPKLWDGASYLDESVVVTTLDVAAIEAATIPVDWWEERAVCEVPPIILPIEALLDELREVAAEMAAEAAHGVGGGEHKEP